MKQPTISVVIPVYNEEKLLPKSLESLSRQTLKPLEIIVVDNNSIDNSAAIAMRYPLVRVVKEPQQGITYARTRGFDEAKGEILVRIDADTIVSPDFLKVYREAFVDDKVAAACGYGAIAEISPANRYFGTWLIKGCITIHQLYTGAGPIMYGYNCALRKTTWDTIRPMLSIDDREISEDIDITFAILSNDLKIKTVPKAKSKVYFLRSLKPRKMIRYFLADRRTFAKYDLKRRKHQLVRPDAKTRK